MTYPGTSYPGSDALPGAHILPPTVRRAGSGWRYFAERLNGDGTATLLHPDLPLSSVSIDYALSGPGGLSCTVEPENLTLMGPDGRPLFKEWSTAIWAEKDGLIRGGGIVDHVGVDNASLSVECTGFSGYLRDLPYTSSRFFIETDPLDIVRHIWDHAQAQPGGDLGVTIDRTTRTPRRIGTELRQAEFDTQEGPVSFESGPFKLEWWQTHDLQGVVDDLASDAKGRFEYLEELSWGPGDVVRKHVRFGHPTVGARRDQLRFALGENVNEVPGVEFPGEDYANSILVLGAGEGRTMIRGEAGATDGRLRRVSIVQDKQLRSKAAADGRAKRELALRRGEFSLVDLSVRDHPHAPLGSWGVGDEILLLGDLGWVDNLGGVWVRVVGMSISPETPHMISATVIRTDRVAE